MTTPPPVSDPAVRARLERVRLLSLDVDGVLTDGGIYVDDDGREQRKFNVKDGMGIKRLMAHGVEVAIVSASVTTAITHRARRLGIPHVHTGIEGKRAAVEEACRRIGIGLDAVAHIGDDLNDLPVFEAVGVALCPADAVDEVRAVAHATARPGGAGCVREVCDLIRAARPA